MCRRWTAGEAGGSAWRRELLIGHNAGMGAGFDEDSSELLDAGFAAPERSEDIAYPKIFSKASLPNDTVGAIYSSNARDAKKQEKFPARLASESIATNDHMNLSSTISRDHPAANKRQDGGVPN